MRTVLRVVDFDYEGPVLATTVEKNFIKAVKLLQQLGMNLLIFVKDNSTLQSARVFVNFDIIRFQSFI